MECSPVAFLSQSKVLVRFIDDSELGVDVIVWLSVFLCSAM